MDGRPIGYWLREVDRLVERGFDRVLAGDGLTRRHWQVMNSLPASADEVRRTLTPFPDARYALDDLVQRGFAAMDDGRAGLTETGATTLAALRERVGEFRRRTAAGISREEYEQTVRVLARMAENLRE